MQTLPPGPGSFASPVVHPASGNQGPPPAPSGLGDQLEQTVLDGFGPGQGNYASPTRAEWTAFRGVVAETLQGLRDGDPAALERASDEAHELGYAFSEVDDFLALREIGPGRGWPTVVFNLHPTTGVVVEAPHPGFDLGTPELAWRSFKAFRADAYIVAGAHRANQSEPSPDVPHGPGQPEYSISDPTHARGTLFQAAHEGATSEGSRVVQIHGFSAKKHHAKNEAFPEDLDAVLSDAADDGYDPPGLVAARDALGSIGMKTHLVTFDGPLGGDLGATPNVQHREMEERGLVGPHHAGEFIHIELDTRVRKSADRDARFDRIVDVLKPVFLDEEPLPPAQS